MNTLQLSSFGEPADVVELAEIPSADPGPGQLAVAIEAATINPSDLMLIRGIYGVRPELPAALGAEGVGRVVAVGAGVESSRVGERVLVVPTLEQATWREQTIVDERNAVAIDADGDPLQLAMLGINPITAHSLLHGYVKLAPGAWVAQTGASSATARYVLALATHAGLRTLNVVRRAESVSSLLDAGGDVVLVEGDDLAKQAADAIRRRAVRADHRWRRGRASRAARASAEDRRPDRQLHRPWPPAPEHLDPRSDLPRAERSRL